MSILKTMRSVKSLPVEIGHALAMLGGRAASEAGIPKDSHERDVYVARFVADESLALTREIEAGDLTIEEALAEANAVLKTSKTQTKGRK